MVRSLVVFLVLLGSAANAPLSSAQKQDVATLLRHARIRQIAQEHPEARLVPMQPKGPVPLGPLAGQFDAESVEGDSPDEEPEGPADHDRFVVETFEVVKRLERPVFVSRFRDTQWAFVQGRTLSPLDTTRTADIRARLQAHFGNPTLTLAELDRIEELPAEAIIQFEYWFVLNDSLPLVVIDVNGPLERGIVIASDSRLRSRLIEVRGAFLDRLFETVRMAPYVDYFHNPATRSWFAAGFDGASFFVRRIGRPNLAQGRPVLSTYVSDDPRR